MRDDRRLHFRHATTAHTKTRHHHGRRRARDSWAWEFSDVVFWELTKCAWRSALAGPQRLRARETQTWSESQGAAPTPTEAASQRGRATARDRPPAPPNSISIATHTPVSTWSPPPVPFHRHHHPSKPTDRQNNSQRSYRQLLAKPERDQVRVRGERSQQVQAPTPMLDPSPRVGSRAVRESPQDVRRCRCRAEDCRSLA
eukprot:1311174-Rhodomonas_salina.2